MGIWKKVVTGIVVAMFMCTFSYADFTRDDIALAAKECVVESPDDYLKGSKDFCAQGVFEKVVVVVDGKSFVADLSLNWIGFEVYSKKPSIFWNSFGGIVNKFITEGISATINFRYGGGTLGHCYPNHKNKTIVCEPVLDERIARE